MRTVISRDTEIRKYFVLFVTGLFVVVFIGDWYSGGEYSEGRIFLIIVGITIGLIRAYLLHNAQMVEFDDKFMYVSSRKSNIRVPLENVKNVQLSGTQINKKFEWEIHYKDDNNEDGEVKFISREGDGFEKFKILVKNKNPDIKFKNWF